MTPGEHKRHHPRLYLFLALILLLVLAGIAWRFTPLGEWLTADRVSTWISLFDNQAYRSAALTMLIVLATLLMVPLSAMTVVSALLLGPWLGFLVSLVAALISGTIAFMLGQAMGGELIERYSGSRVHDLSRRLSDRGVLTVAVLRLVPVAPYTVVNLVAGASHLDLGKFLAGSAIGLVLPLAALAWFSESLLDALTDPSPASITVLALALTVIGVGGWLLRRMLRSA